MPQTTGNADAILREFYLEPVREQLNQRAVLMFASITGGDPDSSRGETVPFRGLSRDAEGVEFAGREWVTPAHVSRNEGMGAIREGGALPRSGQQGWTDLRDTIKHNVGVISLTRYAIRLSNEKPGVFLRLLEAETRGMIRDVRKDVNRQAFGNQTGTLAAVTADGANTVTVDTVQYMRVGMIIDIVRVEEGAVLAAERTIEEINETTKVVRYSGADAAATERHRICRTGSWRNEINGLGDLVSREGILHNVDSSLAANKWWRSQVQEGGGNAFSEDLGQQVLDSVGATGNGETEIVLTTRGIRRRYVAQLKSQKRFNDGQSVVLHGGFRAVMFNEYPLLFDDDCPKGTMWFLDPDEFLWIYLPGSDGKADWSWVDDDGAILSRATDRTDRFEGYIAADHDLGLLARNTQGVIKNLQDDAAPVWS